MILLESNDSTTLIFPALPRVWLISSIGSSLAMLAMASYGLVMITRFVVDFGAMQDRGSVWGWGKIILLYVLSVSLWSTFAAYEIVWYRKCRRVPKRIGFDDAAFFQTWPTVRGERQRSWPLNEIQEVRYKDVRFSVPGTTAAQLLIHLRGRRWPIRFPFGGYRVPLGRRFAELLLNAIQRAPSARQGNFTPCAS
jgi:hypothetical protein